MHVKNRNYGEKSQTFSKKFLEMIHYVYDTCAVRLEFPAKN